MKIIVDITNKCNLKCKHCGNLLKACEDCDFVEIFKKIPYRINEMIKSRYFVPLWSGNNVPLFN